MNEYSTLKRCHLPVPVDEANLHTKALAAVRGGVEQNRDVGVTKLVESLQFMLASKEVGTIGID